MDWKIELAKAGWRQTDEREYNVFICTVIKCKDQKQKNAWFRSMGAISRTCSGCVEYFVPNDFEIPQD